MPNIPTRTCTKCKQELPATEEYFSKHKGCKYGLNSVCKKCMASAARDYHWQNHEEVLAKQRAYSKENQKMLSINKNKWVAENRDRVLAIHRRWRERNPHKDREYYLENRDVLLAKQKKSRIANPLKHKESIKKAYMKNREHYLQYQREYQTNNKDKCREWSIIKRHKRRSLEKSLPFTLTVEEWGMCKDFFSHSCAYCGKESKRLHREHVISVYNGGGFTRENIIPACRSCNSSKNSTDMETWYRKQPFFTEERLNKIKQWQGTS